MSLGEALGYIAGSIDKPGRAVRGLLGGRPHEALAALPFSDTLGLTDPSEAVSGRDLTNQWGWTGKHDTGIGATLAGLGTEMALDPLNLIPAGMLGHALKDTKFGKATVGAAKHFGADERGALGLPYDLAKLPPEGMKRSAPEWINNKTWYHGTAAPNMTAESVNPMLTKGGGNLYGRGLYTSGDRGIAESYFKKGVKDRQMNVKNILEHPSMQEEIERRAASGEFNDLIKGFYSIRQEDALANPQRSVRMALDHELDLPGTSRAAEETMRRMLPSYEQPIGRLYQMQSDFGNILDLDRSMIPKRYKQLFESLEPFKMRAHEDLPLSEALLRRDMSELIPGMAGGSRQKPGELIQYLKGVQSSEGPDNLLAGIRRAGYDAMTHSGGVVTGGRKHQVVIGLDPNDVLGLGRKTPYRQFERVE
jgi:hypothetical protein